MKTLVYFLPAGASLSKPSKNIELSLVQVSRPVPLSARLQTCVIKRK